MLNGLESSNGSAYTTIVDYNQEDRTESCDDCGPSRKLIVQFLSLVFLLVFGGFGLALWVLYNIDENRRLLCASLTWLGLGCLCVGWGLLVGWLAFGLPFKLHRYPWGHNNKQHYSLPHGQNVSQKVLTSPYFSYYNNYMANVLSTDKQAGIIGALCEGSRIRSIERMTGVHRDTIMRLGVRVGQGCMALMNAKMRNLSCTRLEMDEIWGFVGKKQKNVGLEDDPSLGDVWTFCAIDADTKLVPAFMVGKRDKGTANAFVEDISGRMNNRLQISTDGLAAYVDAIAGAFGNDVDFAQIIKTYGHQEVSNNRRHSAPDFVSSEKIVVIGNPDNDLISASYVERLNATTRLHMRRLTRLTLAFSKKLDNFEAAVGLHFAYYNFVKRHSTIKCTPAMAAGVAANQWSVEDLVKAV
jgi:IS1 family transposase